MSIKESGYGHLSAVWMDQLDSGRAAEQVGDDLFKKFQSVQRWNILYQSTQSDDPAQRVLGSRVFSHLAGLSENAQSLPGAELARPVDAQTRGSFSEPPAIALNAAEAPDPGESFAWMRQFPHKDLALRTYSALFDRTRSKKGQYVAFRIQNEAPLEFKGRILYKSFDGGNRFQDFLYDLRSHRFILPNGAEYASHRDLLQALDLDQFVIGSLNLFKRIDARHAEARNRVWYVDSIYEAQGRYGFLRNAPEGTILTAPRDSSSYWLYYVDRSARNEIVKKTVHISQDGYFEVSIPGGSIRCDRFFVLKKRLAEGGLHLKDAEQARANQWHLAERMQRVASAPILL